MQLASFADTSKNNVPLCAGELPMRGQGLSPVKQPTGRLVVAAAALTEVSRGRPLRHQRDVARMWRKRLGSPTQLHNNVRPISSALSPVRNVSFFLAVQFYARRHFA
jgi:hypothetical protein